MKNKIIFTILILLIPFVLATNASTENYQVEKTHLGLSGNNASTQNYEFRFTTTHQQTGNINTSSDSYFANIGWFDFSRENISTSDSSPTTPTSPGGGSSGGGSTIKKETLPAFELDKELIKISTKLGETFKTTFQITNTGEKTSSYKIQTNFQDKVIFSEKSFSLNPKETKEITLTFYSTSDTPPDVYTGKIILTNEEKVEKEINVIFEVKSKKVLFDVSLDIPSQFKELFAGQEILTQLTLFNLGDTDKVDAKIIFLIKDFNGNTLASKEELVAVETQASLSRKILLPNNLEEGVYTIIAKVIYGDSVGTSSDIFHIITEKKSSEFPLPIYLIIFGVIIILLIIILFEFYQRKMKKSFSNYDKKIKKSSKEIKKQEKETIKANKKDQELKSKIDILTKAYKEKHISKQAFEKSKKRIQEARKKLKRKYL
jgi:hypothetical protein